MQGNLHAVHSDPKLFPEPEKFKPERFVKDNKLANTENVMPFSIGKFTYFKIETFHIGIFMATGICDTCAFWGNIFVWLLSMILISCA